MSRANFRSYQECETCAAKAGTVTLCAGCYNNRLAVEQRDKEIEQLEAKMKLIKLTIELCS